MDRAGWRARKPSRWNVVLLAAVIGVALTEVIADKPQLFTPDPASGRVCVALKLVPRWSGRLFHYTTESACAVSWGFASLGVVAALALATPRPDRR